jgi:hypothetical protein
VIDDEARDLAADSRSLFVRCPVVDPRMDPGVDDLVDAAAERRPLARKAGIRRLEFPAVTDAL